MSYPDWKSTLSTCNLHEMAKQATAIKPNNNENTKNTNNVKMADDRSTHVISLDLCELNTSHTVKHYIFDAS